jgi:pimeloyl-ACP methyl ester carboxylesterase
MASIVVPHLKGLLEIEVSPADLIALAAPTLLFYGGASFDFEALIAAAWSRHRPDIELITIAGASHNLHHEHPDVVNPLIIDFLDTTPRL